MAATDPHCMGGPLPPGSWLGVLGGGQLGRMFAMAAQTLGYRVCVLDPAEDSPAGSVAERHLCADYLDAAALAEMGALCGAVTTEFENVPAKALATLARHCRVTPSAEAVAVAQDRIEEKRFIESCGVPVAPYRAIRQASDLHRLVEAAAGVEAHAAVVAPLLPGILKLARLGYDGKGQARIANAAEAIEAYERFVAAAAAAGEGPPACVLEQHLDLAREISVIVARGGDGPSVTFPVGENVHVDGILATTAVPAAIDAALADRARHAAATIAQRLDYVGVLCVEFFVLRDGRLVANEMAPRPHNSGHWSIDAAVTSQFEQQARIMAGLPLGAADSLWPSLMLNILGDAWHMNGQKREPDWAAVLAHPGAKLHLYGKCEARVGRKMGHLTVIADTAASARAQAVAIGPLIAQRLP